MAAASTSRSPLEALSPPRGVAASPRAAAPEPHRRPVPKLSALHLGRLILVGTDVLLIGVAVSIGYLLRFHFEIAALEAAPMAPVIEYLKVAALMAPAILLLCRSWGLFRLASLQSTIEEFAVIIKAVTVATGMVLMWVFFSRTHAGEGFAYSRLVFAYFWPVCILLLATSQLLFRSWHMGRYRRGLDRRRTLLVGRSPSYLAGRLARESSFGLEVVGCVRPLADAQGSSRGTLVTSARADDVGHGRPLAMLGGLGDLPELISQHEIEEVVVVDQGLTHAALLETIDVCERRDVKVRMIPAVYDLLVQPEDFTYVHGVPLLRVDERRYEWVARVSKRLFDLGLSLVLMSLSLPLFLLVWVLVRLESPGSAIFAQLRAGEGGRPFRMFKFRTMVDGAEGRLAEVVNIEDLREPAFKIDDDPRVTRLGRFLRRTSLDELPQLLNVIRGEMSLVGPRPEELRIVERYDVWQRRRLKVKPGITGLQQVEARGSLSELNDRVRLDVHYIRKQSMLLDVVILARTVWAVLRGKGAS